VERLFVVLADDTEQETKKVISSFIDQSDPKVWPPWPWPPWGDDNDPGKDKDKDKDKDKKGPKMNKTLEAHKLAKAVVEFEAKLANASLDLCVGVESYFYATVLTIKSAGISCSRTHLQHTILFHFLTLPTPCHRFTFLLTFLRSPRVLSQFK
jgi:hypothetical protein